MDSSDRTVYTLLALVVPIGLLTALLDSAGPQSPFHLQQPLGSALWFTAILLAMRLTGEALSGWRIAAGALTVAILRLVMRQGIPPESSWTAMTTVALVAAPGDRAPAHEDAALPRQRRSGLD